MLLNVKPDPSTVPVLGIVDDGLRLDYYLSLFPRNSKICNGYTV
jgi:hypothetical protein